MHQAHSVSPATVGACVSEEIKLNTTVAMYGIKLSLERKNKNSSVSSWKGSTPTKRVGQALSEAEGQV